MRWRTRDKASATWRRVKRKARRRFIFAAWRLYPGAPDKKEFRPVKIGFAFVFVAALASPAFAVDPTGVPQCDALLKRYEACSGELPTEKVHAAQKELLDGAMGIRAAAGDPKLRPDLERFCDDTFEKMKTQSDIKDCMSKK
jgi:hypothetical protein